MPTYLIDDIEQVFDSHGNKHFVLSVASGECHADGSDIGKRVLTLAIPKLRIAHFLNLIEEIRQQEDLEAPQVQDEVTVTTEELGDPLFSHPLHG